MNITFSNIIINNFLSIGHAEVDLSEQGFILVKGLNLESGVEQSNGSGKSSIFDAIFYTINGDTLRGTTEVVREGSKDGCSCELTLQVDDKTYKIIRSKNHPTLGNTCQLYEDDVLISDQTKKSQDMISKLIPVTSSDILGSIALLGQGLPYKFSSLSPIKRKDLLETMSGTGSQIDKVKYQLDLEESKYNRTKEELTGISIKSKAVASSAERSKQSLIEQRDALGSEGAQGMTDKITSLSGSITELQSQIAQVDEKLPAAASNTKSISEVRDNLKDFITRTNIEISTLTSQKSQLVKGICPTCKRPFDITDDQKRESEAVSAQITEKSSLLNTLNAKLAGVNSQLDSAVEVERNLNNIKVNCQHQISDLNNQINSLNDLIKISDSLQAKIDEAEVEIKTSLITAHDADEQLVNNQQYLDCINYLKRQMSRDFKGYMLDEVIKYLSERSQYYGEYLFSGNDKISVELSGSKILIAVNSRMYENLSGGERQRVDLAVQFALRDMLVTTTGFSCNILVLDEAFDNLDAQGSEALIKLITSEFTDVDSVFIVTHHAEIPIPYDKVLQVTKGVDHISSIEVM